MKKTQLIDDWLRFLEVVPPGFEPGQAEPKSDVLPLHHGTIKIEK